MKITPRGIIAVATYIVSILAVNWLFAPAQIVPGVTTWATPLGDFFLANLVVGFVFVFRDYAQRAIGHWVLLATVVAGLITYQMVDVVIAYASIIAFILSEMTDWGVYSFWKQTLQKRILVSSLISVPLDTVVFQYLAGYLTPAAFTLEVLSKAVGVAVVWYLLRLRVGNAETSLTNQTI